MKNHSAWLTAFVAVFFAAPVFAFRVNAPRDPGMLKPVLDHVLAPREAIDLGSESAWVAANVATGTKWDSPGIKWETTLVPGSVWFKMWNKPPEPNEAYYRRTFTLTKEQARRAGRLCFELAGPTTDVILNGTAVGTSRFWCLPFDFDVTGLLKEGENVLQVRVYNGPDYANGNGKNFPQTYGWAIGMYSGLTRPVHLELYDPVHVEDVRIDTKVVGGKELAVSVCVTNGSEVAWSGKVCGEVKVEGQGQQWMASSSVELKPGEGKVVELKMPWLDAHFWSPDDPYLYYLKISLNCSPSPSNFAADALRVRFGFREVSIADGRLCFNGHPMMNRRDSVNLDGLGDWGGDRVNPCEKTMRERVALLKSRGIVSMRGGTVMAMREMRVCDEEGFLYSPLIPTGAGYSRGDAYWPVVSNMVASAVCRFRNHPSLLNWCLFNEFGSFYGVGSWKEQYPKMCAMGAWQRKLDPAHFWTSCGDAELCPTNAGAPGPAPVRSLHYPVNMSWNGDFPEIAYWYANGRASWQGVARKDKPLFISEDLYHGMNDAFQGMGRWGNDAVYTAEGYARAWKDCLLMCADGYYYGGVSEWNPWFLHSTKKDNRLFDDGNEAMPTWLVSRRHGYPNVAAGSVVEDELFVYNQSFTERTVTLVRTDTFDGKKVAETTETFTVAPGGRKELKLEFTAPAANGAKVGEYKITYELTANRRSLTTRGFSFNVLPEPKQLPRGIALLASGETPLKALFGKPVFGSERIFTAAAQAIASKPDVIVCAGGLTPDEGRAVDAWVAKGGRAVRFAPTSQAWSPVRVVDRRGHAYAYRRDAAFLPDVPDTLWRVWRPDSFLCHVALEKPTDRDLRVLVDSSEARGFNQADVVRIVQGKGTWLVTSLPIEASWTVEPAARYLALRLVMDEARAAAPVSGGYAFLTKDHSLETFFRQADFLPPTALKDAAVVLMDGARELTVREGETILALAKSGKTVFITEATTNSNVAAYAKFGFTLRAAPYYKPGSGLLRDPPLDDYRLDWFARVGENRGLLAGIPNTEFFYSSHEICNYFAGKVNGSRELHTDRPPLANALIDGGTPLLFPAVLNEIAVGKGRIVLTTLPWRVLSLKYPDRVTRIWRAFLNNSGARTAKVSDGHTLTPCEMGSCKGLLWEDPDRDLRLKVWFDNGDDMRYFPVNLCGWSVVAGNKCPVEPFPKGVLRFGGIPFLLREPNKQGGTVSYGSWVDAPSKAGSRLTKLWLLAALEDDEGLKKGDRVLDILPWDAETNSWSKRVDGEGVGRYGVHIGAYRKPIALTEGRIGWEGHSEKTKNACLYVFAIDNPSTDKSRPISKVLVRNTGPENKKIPKLAILGVCWQED